jgi:hypothetical protein
VFANLPITRFLALIEIYWNGIILQQSKAGNGQIGKHRAAF